MEPMCRSMKVAVQEVLVQVPALDSLSNLGVLRCFANFAAVLF